MGEEAGSFFRRFSGLAPGRLAEVEHGAPGEGEEVEGGERHGQIGLAMAEIVFELVAVVFQDVEAFVLDLPPGAAAGDGLGDGALGDRQRGDQGRLVFDLALGVESPDLIRGSKPIQLTSTASLPSRRGTFSTNR